MSSKKKSPKDANKPVKLISCKTVGKTGVEFEMRRCFGKGVMSTVGEWPDTGSPLVVEGSVHVYASGIKGRPKSKKSFASVRLRFVSRGGVAEINDVVRPGEPLRGIDLFEKALAECHDYVRGLAGKKMKSPKKRFLNRSLGEVVWMSHYHGRMEECASGEWLRVAELKLGGEGGAVSIMLHDMRGDVPKYRWAKPSDEKAAVKATFETISRIRKELDKGMRAIEKWTP